MTTFSACCSECELCAVLIGDEYRIHETEYWDVRLAYQQMRPGRCLTISKRHAGLEADLSRDEWVDLWELRQQLHPAILAAFGASHLNTCLLMNKAFDGVAAKSVNMAHIHYWDIPRYRNSVTIQGVAFVDPAYPFVNPDEFSADNQVAVSEELMRGLVEVLRDRIGRAVFEKER